jgi:hypothetical protein
MRIALRDLDRFAEGRGIDRNAERCPRCSIVRRSVEASVEGRGARVVGAHIGRRQGKRGVRRIGTHDDIDDDLLCELADVIPRATGVGRNREPLVEPHDGGLRGGDRDGRIFVGARRIAHRALADPIPVLSAVRAVENSEGGSQGHHVGRTRSNDELIGLRKPAIRARGVRDHESGHEEKRRAYVTTEHGFN